MWGLRAPALLPQAQRGRRWRRPRGAPAAAPGPGPGRGGARGEYQEHHPLSPPVSPALSREPPFTRPGRHVRGPGFTLPPPFLTSLPPSHCQRDPGAVPPPHTHTPGAYSHGPGARSIGKSSDLACSAEHRPMSLPSTLFASPQASTLLPPSLPPPASPDCTYPAAAAPHHLT